MAVLSVVIAAHGVAPYLGECLDSVLAGAPADLDVVGVDDASPDECGEILDDYAARDARVRAVHLSPNHGLGPARNAGLDIARGDYVWFVDGDDRLAHGASGRVAAQLAESHPDVLLLRHAFLVDGRVRPDPRGARVPRFSGTATTADRPQLLRVRQAAWNRVVCRDALAAPGLRFPEGWYEDVAFSHLSLVAADRVAIQPGAAYLYRQRDGAITATVSPRHFEVFRQYERLYDELDPGVPAAVRAELFELMIEHYLVVVGTEGRVPDAMRPDFFSRIVEHYHRYLPPEGYPTPPGVAGLKQRFVRWDAYGLFHTFRTAYRSARRARSALAHLHQGGQNLDETPPIASRRIR
jgi:glycosyltransferase involved in cell wall biosynthesis